MSATEKVLLCLLQFSSFELIRTFRVSRVSVACVSAIRCQATFTKFGFDGSGENWRLSVSGFVNSTGCSRCTVFENVRYGHMTRTSFPFRFLLKSDSLGSQASLRSSERTLKFGSSFCLFGVIARQRQISEGLLAAVIAAYETLGPTGALQGW